MTTILASLIDRPLSSLCYWFSRTPAHPIAQRQAVEHASTDSRPCRFRLDNDTSATLEVADGRDVGYAEYGSPRGTAVFFLHGLPGSRLEAAFWDDVAKQKNVHLISLDRPGMGWSSPQPGRTLLDHAKDVKALAEHLKVQQYGVVGVSGGGQYALACAASLPQDNLKAAAVVCGMGPPELSKRGMAWPHYAGFTIGFTHFPRLSRWYFESEAMARIDLSDDDRMSLMKKQFLSPKTHAKDRQFFEDDDILRVSLVSGRNHYLQSSEACIEDGALMSANTGFRIADIPRSLPVGLWYARHDTACPVIHGQQTAERLGASAELHIEDETHASISINRMGEVFDFLKSKMLET